MQLDEGKEVFEAAKAAIRRWDQFHFSWLEADLAETPIQVSEFVAVMSFTVTLDSWELKGRPSKLFSQVMRYLQLLKWTLTSRIDALILRVIAYANPLRIAIFHSSEV